VDDGTGKIVRRRGHRRARTGALAAALPAALLALAGCGAASYDTSALARDITTRLDRHPGWAVRSVKCPAHARQAKGVIIRCSATLRNGSVVTLRATELDDHGTIHLVASQMFADNVERGIVAGLPAQDRSARVVCPNHVPVVIGNAFTCTLAGAGPLTRARVTIVDGDGGFRVSLS
jgi:hypothetical protein